MKRRLLSLLNRLRWCWGNLPFGVFEVNGLEPPLPYEDDSFDLVYALSVVTHTFRCRAERCWSRAWGHPGPPPAIDPTPEDRACL